MSKLTKEFVDGFLERYDGDFLGPILDLADGGNPLHALLEGLDRKDIIEWLQEEFDGLLMHGFEPAQDIDLPERKNSELLLGFLEKTKPENSRGLQFEIEGVGDPEEGYTPEKYIQAYEVSIRYEGTELGTCALESEGAYISGKWGRRIRSVANLIARSRTICPRLLFKNPSISARNCIGSRS